MNMNKLLTPYNFNTGAISRIKYVVIHYVGALGGARASCAYYAGQKLGASAHYFVDFDGSIWQSVEDKDIAWHCGATTYKHPACRNSNSIGIEMCVRKTNTTPPLSSEARDWYFEDATVKATIELTKWLMAKYNVPAENVIRHYDVTGKVCPNPYVYNQNTWGAFKAAIGGTEQTTPPSTAYTLKEFIQEVQSAIGAGVDGIAGPETLGKTPTISSTKNNRHAAVRPVQKRLNALGFDVGAADGIAGVKFDAGARKFQGSFGGMVDGEFTAGKLSWKKLLGMAT